MFTHKNLFKNKSFLWQIIVLVSNISHVHNTLIFVGKTVVLLMQLPPKDGTCWQPPHHCYYLSICKLHVVQCICPQIFISTSKFHKQSALQKLHTVKLISQKFVDMTISQCVAFWPSHYFLRNVLVPKIHLKVTDRPTLLVYKDHWTYSLHIRSMVRYFFKGRLYFQ